MFLQFKKENMKDFVFVNKTSGEKCTLRTDIIDGNDRFTIMYLEGVRGTEFETIMPFNQSTVMTVAEMEKWFKDYSTTYNGYIYGGEQIVVLEATTFNLVITPTITGATQCEITLNATKEGENPIQDVITLNNDQVKTLKILEGWTYEIKLPKGEINSGDPGSWEADADKAIELAITIPA
jgi:hypothetical protein